MDIMSKIQSKESLLQVLHTHAIDPTNPISFMPVLQLTDLANSTGAPGRCLLINELHRDASAFDAEPTPIDPQQMHRMVERIDIACDFGAIPDAVKQLSSRPLTRIYCNAKVIMLANELITPNAFWVWRECARFYLHKYTAPLFLEQLRQLGKLNPSLWWHFPHISVDEPTMVAYTPSPDYGRADRQVRMKIGRYLTQFYSEMLTQNQIRSMANGVKSLSFHMGKTSADFKRIYEDGVSSCMSCMGGSRIGDISGDYHPAEVYGSGDFAITWLTDDATDQLVARAIVAYPDQPNNGGHFVRLYGAEALTLEDKLIEMGYERQSGYADGLRLLAIQDDDNNYLMPYIDGNEYTVSLTRGFWVIGYTCGEHCHDARETNGIYRSGGTCDACGDQTNEDEEDMVYSDYHGIRIGQCCIDDYTWCYSRHGDRDYIHQDDVVYCETDGEYYHDAYLDRHGIVYCDTEGAYRCESECVQNPDGEWMHEEDAVKITNSDGDYEYYHNRDTHAASRVTVRMPSADNGLPVCYIGDLPEDIAKIHDEATRFVDDYGNEWVSGFVTMHQLIRYARDVTNGLKMFRSIEGVPFDLYANRTRVDILRSVLPAYVL